jgi:hypothetical protein
LINFVFNDFTLDISMSIFVVEKQRKKEKGRRKKKGEWMDGREEGKKENKKTRKTETCE